jgi:hypothetical protein
LLPQTPYLCIRSGFELGGPSILQTSFTAWNGTEVVYKWRWEDNDDSPLCIDAKPGQFTAIRDISDRLIEEAGINPHHFVQAAAANIYSSGMDGLTFLAELHKTVRMIKRAIPRAVKLLREAFNALRTGRLYALGYSTIDEWLQARYGWRILLYEIQEINQLLEGLDEPARSRVKNRSGHTLTVVEGETRDSGGGNGRIINDYTTYTIGVRGSIIADFSPSSLTFNLPLTAWELLPYSFVIDWFVNIGQTIEALSFLTFNNQYTASYGIYVEGTREVTVNSYPGPNWGNNFQSNWGEITLTEKVEMFRRVPTTVPQLPHLQLNLDGFKIADLIALLLNAVR